MKTVMGSPGTASGLLLRLGQCLFACASVGVMVSALGFSNYTAFCYLIASMGLQVLWSLALACLDIYALRIKRDLQNLVLVSLFVVGDWVTAALSFAAACSSAGVTVLFKRDADFCRLFPQIDCHRFSIKILHCPHQWIPQLAIVKIATVSFIYGVIWTLRDQKFLCCLFAKQLTLVTQ